MWRAACMTELTRILPENPAFLPELVKTMNIKSIFLALWLAALPIAAYAADLGTDIEQFGDSVLNGLDNLSDTLNQANSSLFGANPANNPQSYEEQMRAYRQTEAARVREMATVTGVNPDVIQEMRWNGMTWEQIADKYNVNLQDLPVPIPSPTE